MKVKVISLLIMFTFTCYLLFSQHGNLYLYNYSIPLPNIDYKNYAVIQDKQGVIYFANKNTKF